MRASSWRRLLVGGLLLTACWWSRTLWAQYPPGLQIATDGPAVLLEDYASLPLSSVTPGSYPPPIDLAGQRARVNFLRAEPAAAPSSSGRLFVSDSNRSLYILNKTTRLFTPYLNFEEIFPKFVNTPGFSGGLVTFAFGPEYVADGKFYTVHLENPAKGGSIRPTNASVPGLVLGGYTTTASVNPPAGSSVRQAVLVEWTDTDISDAVFQGTAREVLRVGFTTTMHPIGDILFNPNAHPGHPDFGNLYIAVGDGGAGELPRATKSIPQRLDALQGKILRITPDLDLRSGDLLGGNGRYRIPTTGPDPNPFVSSGPANARKEVFAYGFRNPHRLSWDAVTGTLIANDIGLNAWEEVNIVNRGANYGYPEREGPEQLFVLSANRGMTGSQTSPPTPLPSPDTLAVAGLATPVVPAYPVIAYSHREGDAIGSGFVYRGALVPELYGMYVFGDITTGRIFYADVAAMLVATRTSPAAIHELRVVHDSPYDSLGAINRRVYDIVTEAYAARGGGSTPTSRQGVLPGDAAVVGGSQPGQLDVAGVGYGGGRADIRVVEGGDGEIYVLSKSDGMIRAVRPVESIGGPPDRLTEANGGFAGTAPAALAVPPSPTVLALPGLVAGYAFNEGTGSTTQDVSGNNLTGTISGATWTTAGRFGGALAFDGVNDWVTVADANALDLTTGMTLEAWVFPIAAGSGTWRNVLIKERANGEVYNLYAKADTNVPAVYVVRSAQTGTPLDARGTAALPLNSWTHLSATHDGTTLRLYVNGVQVGTRAVAGALLTSTGVLRIGGNSLWGEYFQGRIDEIRVYNRALTAAEIQSDMNAPVGEPGVDTTPPTRSNPQPTGALAAGTTQATLSLTTDEPATCRYGTSPGIAYSAMSVTFATTGSTSHSSPVTGLVNGGAYTYYVRCQDLAGNANTTDTTIAFSVSQPGLDTVNPSVALTAPANGSTVAGVVTVTATASDNVGVAGVQFLLDGANLGAEDTVAPYTVSWDTTLVPGGTHVLRARARDLAGNTTTSDPVGVSVVNGSVPANFVDEVVVGSGVTFPTALEFLPDGRMLIAEFTGRILVVQPGGSAPGSTPVLELSNFFREDVTVGGERGLVNVLADPGFATNGFIYLFYTAASPQRDRVSRFTMVGNTASLASEFVVWQAVANSTSTDHHGGGLAFGPDGKLYISTGDNGDPQSVQSLTSDHGKILRVNADGTVPTDNPFFDGSGPNIDAVWVRGLRNPYRFSFDSANGRMYIGDVGQSAVEEINIGVAGANYGWPVCEGSCGTTGMTNPLFSYAHSGRDASVTGGFVYRGSQFPAAYQGVYFYGDFAQNWIRYLTINPAGTAVTGGGNFLPADGALDGPYDPVMLKPGPEGSLYYVDFGWGWQSTANPASIRRIRYVAGNQPPIAAASGTPLNGPAPLLVSFSSAGSVDPEGQPLSYSWTFGDGTTSTLANPTHTYTAPGLYSARLSVSDGVNTTMANALTVAVGTLPVGVIAAPANGATFRAGEVITFSGSATDAEDGPLAAASMTWTVLFHHDTHVHPAVSPLVGSASGSFTIQTSGHDFSGATSYEIILTVVDSHGLQSSSSVTIRPEKVNLTFMTSPAGLTVTIDGVNHVTPYVHDTLIGFRHAIGAPAQVSGPLNYAFDSWSDGGSQTHDIVVPATPVSYTAAYTATGSPPVPPGLVAGYGFNDGGGSTAQDSSGNNLTGIISGAAWTTEGRFGSALSFNGVSDWVTVPDADALDLTTGMTLEAWVFPTAAGGVRDILIKEGAGVDIYNLYARNGQGAPEANVYVGGSNRWAAGPVLPLSSWSHVAGTYDGATVRLYINGVQAASTAVTGPIGTSNGVLRIGGNSLWGEYFQGRIDEIRVYNRALSAAEIQIDMNTPVGALPIDTTPPVLSGGQPTGTLAAGTTQALLGVATNEPATCRYSLTAGMAYEAMPATFTTTGATVHSSLVAGLVNGASYQYYLRCRDAAGNTNASDFTIAFSVAAPPPIDSVPPVVTLTAPVNGSTVSGTVTVSATATDNVGVVGVQFLLNGAPLGAEDTTSPYSIAWDSTSVPNGGPYQLSARARDAAGNQGTSPSVSVTVDNRVSAGLVAAYGFNEGSGSTAQDRSGNSLHGAISGATWTTDGRFGNALSFDGVNDWVTVADANPLDLTIGMTLEAWVYPTASGGGSWRNVLIKERAGGEVYNLYSNMTGNVPTVYVIRAAQTGTPLNASGVSAVPLNTWTHLTATHDGTTLRLYVNGAQVGTRAVSGALLTSTGALRIGGNSPWGEFFQGRIDEIRIYNRALSVAEIQADMATPVP